MRRAATVGMRAACAVLLASLVALFATASRAQAPANQDVLAHRSADGARVEASAVGMPDWRFPTMEARCVSGREAGFRRARGFLHDYVDRALRASDVTPEGLVSAHGAVDGTVRVTSTRGLVDCAAVVNVAVGVSELERAVLGAEVHWP